MKIRTYILLIIILIIISLLILVKNYNENIVGDDTTDSFTLEKEDLKFCCEYINDDGGKKTCSVLKKYSCDLCTTRCT